MTYDPFQTYPPLGTYYGITAPISSPYAALQTPMNPAAALNPLAAALGMSPNVPNAGISQIGQQAIPGVATQNGISPQHLQLAALLAAQGAIPQWLGLSPLANGMFNPQLAAGFQNPQLNPMLAAAGFSGGPQFGHYPHSMYGQIGQNPFAQTGQPFGGPIGSPFGQQVSAPWQTSQFFGQGLPFGQASSPFGQIGYPLAPQSWVGQAGPFGGGQPFSQGNPLLSQLGPRPFQSPGISPWGY